MSPRYPRVRQLAYLGLRVSDVAAWREFGSDVLGVGVEPLADGVRFRLDERDHRIQVRAAGDDALDYLGWEVSGEDEFDAMVTKLRDLGVEMHTNSDATSADRGFGRSAWFVDPCGIRSEIAVGPIIGKEPFLPSRPMGGFVTGEMGFGHIFVYVDDTGPVTDFYRNALGFEISDYITWPEADIDAVFLRCNARHHSLAFAMSKSSPPNTLEHFMLEVRSVDDVGRALDLAASHASGLFSTLGRHSNDLMLSFYGRTPSGFLVEYGCDAIQVPTGDGWSVKRYTNGHTWGHARIGPEARLLPFREHTPAAAQARPSAGADVPERSWLSEIVIANDGGVNSDQ